jgi:glycosyltransferase involved in cell wall biosynthesis
MITILLPVYNDEAYISECIRSIKIQTHKDFLCYIGFNGTTDRSKKIVNSLVSNDTRFKVFDYGNDKGKPKTLNKLLKEVNTEFICLIDGDDVWEINKLERQFKVRNDFSIIGTFTSYIDKNSKVTSHLSLPTKDNQIKYGLVKCNNYIVNSSVLLKTIDAREVNGWDEELDFLEDYDMWIRLYKNGKTFFNIDEYLTKHRIHSESNFNSKPSNITPLELLVKNKIIKC